MHMGLCEHIRGYSINSVTGARSFLHALPATLRLAKCSTGGQGSTCYDKVCGVALWHTVHSLREMVKDVVTHLCDAVKDALINKSLHGSTRNALLSRGAKFTKTPPSLPRNKVFSCRAPTGTLGEFNKHHYNQQLKYHSTCFDKIAWASYSTPPG
eukprot:1191301-Prorocentrum_minimum.AAC.2